MKMRELELELNMTLFAAKAASELVTRTWSSSGIRSFASGIFVRGRRVEIVTRDLKITQVHEKRFSPKCTEETALTLYKPNVQKLTFDRQKKACFACLVASAVGAFIFLQRDKKPKAEEELTEELKKKGYVLKPLWAEKTHSER
jgi:hypothetical protein